MRVSNLREELHLAISHNLSELKILAKTSNQVSERLSKFSDFFVECISKNNSIYKKYREFILSEMTSVKSLIQSENTNTWELRRDVDKSLDVVSSFVNFLSDKNKYRLTNDKKLKKLILSFSEKDIEKISNLGGDQANNFAASISDFLTEDKAFEFLNGVINSLRGASSYYYRSNTGLAHLMRVCNHRNNERLMKVAESFYHSHKDSHWRVRKEFYYSLAYSGAVNGTWIRRIRSDASSEVSLKAIRSMFFNKDLYENFNELIAKTCDTRYDDVAVYLAENLDKTMLPRLLGTTSYNAKQIVRRRIQ
jgi:hypothetical protein